MTNYGQIDILWYDGGGLPGSAWHGMWTCKSSTGYLTLFYYPGDYVVVSKIAPGIKSAMLLTTGEPLKVEPTTNSRTLIKGLPDYSPDPLAPVIKVEFEGPPYALTEFGAEWLDGTYMPESP